MLDFSKRLGLCLGIAASFCLAACGGESGSSGGGDDNQGVTCGDQTCSETEVCNSENKCVTPECKDDSGCEGDNKECKDYKCVDKAGGGGGSDDGCKEDKDCGDGKKCDNGQCVADGGGGGGSEDECKENSDCGEDKTCEGGKCIGKSTEVTCEAPKTSCEDGCFDLQTDAGHCGDCSTKCDSGVECKDGHCGKVCEDQSQTACGDQCFNLSNDNEHCGKCDQKCGEGESCQSGECKKGCPAGTELCGTECLNFDDNATCGTCESHKACNTAEGEACSDRTCTSMCTNEGEVFCNGACVNFKTDVNNCGGCGEEHKCADGQKCNAGVCGADCGDKMDCDGSCIDPQTDPNFCGATGACENPTVCGEGLKCDAGKCVCQNAGEVECKINENESICTDPKTSAAYCGCGEDNREHPEGINCEALPGISEGKCNAGVCEVKCDASHADCNNDPSDGCEADLNSVDSCGGCGEEFKCNDPNAKEKSCNAGKCEFVCNDGMKTCNGKCTDVTKEKDNCGFCGNQCGDDSTCIDGFCVIDADKCDSDGYVTTKVENANGDKVDVKAYCIYTKLQFEAFRNAVNNSDSSKRKYPDSGNAQNAYILMSDIDLGTQNWTPIGVGDTTEFTNGYFLGNGKKISGKLTVNSSTNSINHSGGLFGSARNSYFYGLNLDLELNSQQSGENTGIMLGRAYGGGTFIHNRVKGTLSSNVVDVGMMIGDCNSGGNIVIKRCTASGTVKGGGRTGGLVGRTGQPTVIVDSHADVQIPLTSQGSYGAGGLIGSIANQTTIQNCSAAGQINDSSRSSYTGAGGLVGQIEAATTIVGSSSSVYVNTPKTHRSGGLVGNSYSGVLQVSNSYATGNVLGTSYIGGLIGVIGAWDTVTNCGTISDCYATGNVTGKDQNLSTADIGGLVGVLSCGNVQNSYATGDVNGYGNVGGFAGWSKNVQIQNCYATGDVTSAQGSIRTGGFIGGWHGNIKATQIYATGKVSGGDKVGGLIGSMEGGELSFCGAFGNAENATFLMSQGSTAGSLIGVTSGTNTIVNCLAWGDASGKDVIGSVIGEATGNTTVRNVYGAGALKGNTYVGGFVGKFTGGSNSLAIKNSFFWEKAASDAIGAGSAAPNEATVFPFKYNDTKEAIHPYTSKKLSDVLGTDWVPTKCTLKSGVKEEVTLPMLKALSANVCQ